MAFNGLQPSGGPFVLADGASTQVWVRRNVSNGHGSDLGAQWIMADPIGPGSLQVDNFVKQRNIVVPNQLEVVYLVTVTNVGFDDSLFSVQGGGNV
jgi:hypothetical protein